MATSFSKRVVNDWNHLHASIVEAHDENLTFQELLGLDDSMTIHHKNIQKLAIEMFKIKNNLSSPLVKKIFTENTNTYDLRKIWCWESTNVRTVHYGTGTISYRGPKTWDMVPQKHERLNITSGIQK